MLLLLCLLTKVTTFHISPLFWGVKETHGMTSKEVRMALGVTHATTALPATSKSLTAIRNRLTTRRSNVTLSNTQKPITQASKINFKDLNTKRSIPIFSHAKASLYNRVSRKVLNPKLSPVKGNSTPINSNLPNSTPANSSLSNPTSNKSALTILPPAAIFPLFSHHPRRYLPRSRRACGCGVRCPGFYF